MSINPLSEIEKIIGRLKCGEGKDCSRATAFLISPDIAITARHAIEGFYSDNEQITLEFLNLDQNPIVRKATPVKSTSLNKSAVSILKLNKDIEFDSYLNFTDYKVEKDDDYEVFGYPVVKWNIGDWIKSSVVRKITSEMTNPYDWDIDLHHNSKIQEFEGLSGSPLFINTKLVGVVLTETTAAKKAISLGAISVQRIKSVLEKTDILVEDSPTFYDMDEIYELEKDNDYSESLFIAKLESANIHDHEDCQQEFFNAEIAKSSIESRGILTEEKKFNKLKYDIRSVWKTNHRPYENEEDGNNLLASVYQRVEDLSDSLLKYDGNLPLIVKKGVLHQLSDECKVGWVKNYPQRIKEYLLEKEK